jgi:hypothetical protein
MRSERIVSATKTGDTTMLSYTRITLAAALVLGAASPGFAKDRVGSVKAAQSHTVKSPAGHERVVTPGFNAYGWYPGSGAEETYIKIQDQGYRNSIGD